jgi:hypothetical protein
MHPRNIWDWFAQHYRVFLIAFVILMAFGLSVFISVVYYMYAEYGNHVPNLNVPIVYTVSLYEDVLQSLDVTSISQFSVETVRGMVALMFMATCTSVFLVSMCIIAFKLEFIHRHLKITCLINAIGYFLLCFVGLFGTSLPVVDNLGPRRDYNNFLVFTISDTASSVPHYIGAAGYLVIPTLSTLWYLIRYHHKNKIAFPARKFFLGLYVFLLFCLILLLVTQLISIKNNNNSVLNSTWFLLELLIYSGGTGVFFSFQYVVLHIHHIILFNL